jgi:hypothetical protein
VRIDHVVRRVTLAAIAVGAATSVLAPSRAHAQMPPAKAEVHQDWIEMKDTMMKIADAMPGDKFSFKSTPEQRSYGEQILHVASTNALVLSKDIGGKSQPPSIDMKATSKAKILKGLADSFDYGTALIDEQTDQSMLQTVKTVFHVRTATRSRIFYLLIGHAWDIYGQMAVYLRLNGITPPASRRP